MGQFSWLDCKDTSRQILDNVIADVFLLIPQEFGGGSYHESCYNGYGMFGSHDVYEEVATWNRKNITTDNIEKPVRSAWPCDTEGNKWYQLAVSRYEKQCKRLIDFRSGKTPAEMTALYGRDYLREIGIDIACLDSQNKALKYPIKITHDATAIYKDCNYSPADPNQGWADDEE